MPIFRSFVISIHALREEGDNFEMKQYYLDKRISIHALREEGDRRTAFFLV